MFNIVKAAGQAGIDGRRLRQKLFASDVDGGPASANIVPVMAQQINKKLFRYGIQIRAGRGKGQPYRLRPLTLP